MGQMRKKWTRDYLVIRLELALQAMDQALALVAEGGGQMSQVLRRRVIATSKKNRGTLESLRVWAVTDKEKAHKLLNDIKGG